MGNLACSFFCPSTAPSCRTSRWRSAARTCKGYATGCSGLVIWSRPLCPARRGKTLRCGSTMRQLRLVLACSTATQASPPGRLVGRSTRRTGEHQAPMGYHL